MDEDARYSGTESSAVNETFGNETAICMSDEHVLFTALVIFSYLTIMAVSLCGNGIISYLVLCNPKFRSVTNLFIVNLSIGDVFMTLYCVPFTFISTIILQHWPFGWQLCSTVSYFQAVSVFVSAYTLVAISLDRYSCIMHPLRPRVSKALVRIVIAVVWLIAFLTALPIVIVSQVFQPDNNCGRFVCTEVWESPSQHFTYSLVLMVLQYVLPFSVLVVTYTRIAIFVWGRKMPGEAENARDARIASSKRKMIKMMVVVVVVYTVCWLPYNVLLIVMGSYEELSEWPGIKYLYFALHWLAMSHTCYNPIIYVYMNSRFQTGFFGVVSRVPCLSGLVADKLYDPRASLGMTATADHYSSLRRATPSTYRPATPTSSLLIREIVNDF